MYNIRIYIEVTRFVNLYLLDINIKFPIIFNLQIKKQKKKWHLTHLIIGNTNYFIYMKFEYLLFKNMFNTDF